jgi:glutathione peroxidase
MIARYTPLFLAALGLVAAGAVLLPAMAADKPAGGAADAVERATSPLDFKVKNIDGEEVALERYRGQVLLIVNVASRCGMTPQYRQLQELHQKYAEKGLRILGFPSNDFGAQEPGTDAEIKQFCTTKYHVTFDMFSKIHVKGEEQAPLFAYLTDPRKTGEHGGEIKWNFTKFVIGRDGKVVARFGPRMPPDDPVVIAAIEEALAAPAPEKKEEK